MARVMHKTGTGKDILFFGRSECDSTLQILDQMQRYGFNVTYVMSHRRAEALPEEVYDWEGDYILCFRSLFILPDRLLKKAQIAAVNFHPAPPEYPGSGCINFALYDNAESYGVTAHLMNAKVDNGTILDVRRFPVHARDTLTTVLSRAHTELQNLCFDFVTGIAQSGERFISSKASTYTDAQWGGDARLMRELDALQTITPDISKAELERIIRATYIESFPPHISLHGYKFYLRLDD